MVASRVAPACLVAGSVLLPPALAGSGETTPVPGPEFELSVTVPSVQVYPVVRSGDEYVRHLTAADFLVLEEGKPVAIDSLETNLCALSVALLIDVSDSMANKLGRVQEAAARFVDRLGSDDQLSIWAFSHQLYRIGPATSDRERAKAYLRQLPGGGGTALFHAVDRVVESTSTLDRNVIVLFTDGRDQSGAIASSTARLARDRGVIIYTLSVPDPQVRLEAQRGTRLLADWTGGESRFIFALDRLDSWFDAIIDDLRAQYRLSFTPSAGPPGVRKIEVKARDRRYTVRCRQHYRYEG